MDKVTLKVKRLPHCKDLPKYATPGSSGMDLTAGIDEMVSLAPGKRIAIPTGIILEIPPGFEGQVRARSGLAAKAGITLTNSVGTIDSDYRGEVGILLINLGYKPYTFVPGERIAQLVIMPVPQVEIVEVTDVEATEERGTGGFGSIGRVQVGVGNTFS